MVENRLHQYGDPPPGWTVVERRQRNSKPTASDERGGRRVCRRSRRRRGGSRSSAAAPGAAASSWSPYGTRRGAGRSWCRWRTASGWSTICRSTRSTARCTSVGQSGRRRTMKSATASKRTPEGHSRPERAVRPSGVGFPAMRNPAYTDGISGTQTYYSEFHFDTNLKPERRQHRLALRRLEQLDNALRHEESEAPRSPRPRG